MSKAEKSFEESLEDKIRDRFFVPRYLISHVVIFKINEKMGLFYILIEGDQGLVVIEKGKYILSGSLIMIQLSSGEKFFIS